MFAISLADATHPYRTVRELYQYGGIRWLLSFCVHFIAVCSFVLPALIFVLPLKGFL